MAQAQDALPSKREKRPAIRVDLNAQRLDVVRAVPRMVPFFLKLDWEKRARFGAGLCSVVTAALHKRLCQNNLSACPDWPIYWLEKHDLHCRLTREHNFRMRSPPLCCETKHDEWRRSPNWAQLTHWLLSSSTFACRRTTREVRQVELDLIPSLIETSISHLITQSPNEFVLHFAPFCNTTT